MSDELLGVIISAVATSIISIIGFIVTYKSMKRNFREELEKEKVSIHIEKMSIVPYNVLQLMDKIIKTKGKGDVLKDFTDLMDTIYAYGSEKAIQIAATMQKENYIYSGTDQFNHYRVISLYILLATQIKYDVTGIVVSPEFWLQMKLTDYTKNRETFRKVNNQIVNQLDLKKDLEYKVYLLGTKILRKTKDVVKMKPIRSME